MTNTTHLYNTDNPGNMISKKTNILEKDIQNIIEKNMETYLGIRFIASEYSTGKTHGGRIDTIGIDENNVPVIIEYKRDIDSSAMIQGLFYLAWLEDHKAEFERNVEKILGKDISQDIDWSEPRVICIANDFHKYVIGSAEYMGPNIELMKYQLYDNGMLTITDIYTKNQRRNTVSTNSKSHIQNTVQDSINSCDDNVTEIFDTVKTFLLELDDSVKMVKTKNYIAFRTNKNFAIVKVFPKKKYVKIGTIVDPTTLKLEEGFTRDMRNIHGNDGPLDIIINSLKDVEKAKSILIRSFNNT